MQGILRKFVEKVKWFQRSVHPKRYFIIDFTIASIVISHGAYKPLSTAEINLQEECTVMPFRDVLDCYLPRNLIDRASLPKNWQYPFFLKTTNRLYTLISKSEHERRMWVAGFRYVIASTVTVQCIMKHNNEKAE